MRTLARAGSVAASLIAAILAVSPALAQSAAAPPKIDTADTAWMISATGLVLMMSLPGLALFYAGMVRKKIVLATMAQTIAAVALGSIVLMVTLIWSGLLTLAILKLINFFVPLRVRDEDERIGLDVTQHGEALQ
jgi:ammonia channel protein AmtB